MRVWFVPIVVLLLGCHPTPKTTPTFVEPAPTPLTISTTPAIVAVRQEIRVVCRLPSTVGDGVYSFGVVDMFLSKGEIDRLEYDRVMLTPCQPFTIFCAYQEYHKDSGFEKPVSKSVTVEPIGDCEK